MKENEVVVKNIESVGDSHAMTSIENMLNDDAFDLSDDEKIAIIEDYFKKINTLGLDLSDDSLNGTPHRVAKMYVKEIFFGINHFKTQDITIRK